jgi:prolyl 4-hydroxylase
MKTTTLAIISVIVGLLILGIIWLVLPSAVHENLRDRRAVDQRLSDMASSIVGTQKTPIYIIDDFLDADECAEIIETSKGALVPSPVTREDPDDPGFRTSETCYFTENNPIQNAIEKKICTTLGLPSNISERSQIQYYEIGNEFKAHCDGFWPGVDDIHLEAGQRTWTFMIYLNDVAKGGKTTFTKIGESITPKRGRAVAWYNQKMNGFVDDETMHQGSPVEEGYKWIVTKWMRDKIQK